MNAEDIKVSSITMIENENSKLKAIATITVNDEVALHGIKVFDGDKGLFVQMPQKRDKEGNYKDIVFPITAEARETINNAVLEKYKNPVSYDDIQFIGAYETRIDVPASDRITAFDESAAGYAEKPDVTYSQLSEALMEAKQFAKQNNVHENDLPDEIMDNIASYMNDEIREELHLDLCPCSNKNFLRAYIEKDPSFTDLLKSEFPAVYNDLSEKEPVEKTVKSKISVSLHSVDSNVYKAAGQITIDDAIVVTGVRVVLNQNNNEKFVSMPSYMRSDGEYAQYAHPITKEAYQAINNHVLAAAERLSYTYKGVKYAELGEDVVTAKRGLNNKFAEKLMAELDKKGIVYHAQIADTTALSVKAGDVDKLKNTEKDLKETLKA